jgi:hypothetical protein
VVLTEMTETAVSGRYSGKTAYRTGGEAERLAGAEKQAEVVLAATSDTGST